LAGKILRKPGTAKRVGVALAGGVNVGTGVSVGVGVGVCVFVELGGGSGVKVGGTGTAVGVNEATAATAANVGRASTGDRQPARKKRNVNRPMGNKRVTNAHLINF
jgi:hypothetical protein